MDSRKFRIAIKILLIKAKHNLKPHKEGRLNNKLSIASSIRKILMREISRHYF
jgi:hypothetical protein